jgi:hypothetical protein
MSQDYSDKKMLTSFGNAIRTLQKSKLSHQCLNFDLPFFALWPFREFVKKRDQSNKCSYPVGFIVEQVGKQ